MPQLLLLGIRELSGSQVVQLGIGQIRIGEHPFRTVHERLGNQDTMLRLDPGHQLGGFDSRRNILGLENDCQGLGRPAVGKGLKRLPLCAFHVFTIRVFETDAGKTRHELRPQAVTGLPGMAGSVDRLYHSRFGLS